MEPLSHFVYFWKIFIIKLSCNNLTFTPFLKLNLNFCCKMIFEQKIYMEACVIWRNFLLQWHDNNLWHILNLIRRSTVAWWKALMITFVGSLISLCYESDCSLINNPSSPYRAHRTLIKNIFWLLTLLYKNLKYNFWIFSAWKPVFFAICSTSYFDRVGLRRNFHCIWLYPCKWNAENLKIILKFLLNWKTPFKNLNISHSFFAEWADHDLGLSGL